MYKFQINDIVIYNEELVQIEDTAIDIKGRNIYLIRTKSNKYYWMYEDNLERWVK